MTNSNLIQNISSNLKESISAKLATIVFLVLLLLIPGEMIRSLISERQMMNHTAISEVNSLWATEQTINGPFLSIPVLYEKQERNEVIEEYIQYWQVLPRTLEVNGQVDPETLKRGIYEIVVYTSTLDVTGNFQLRKAPQDKNLVEIQWDKAFLTLGISDLRGIRDELHISIDGKEHSVEPGTNIPSLASSGVTIPYPIDPKTSLVDFNFQLSLKGSRNLSFTPVGSTTKVKISSPWTSPSFNGHFLPDFREVSESGFNANWKILQLNRNFPEQWLGTGYNQAIQETAFGMNLLLPLEDYQKSIRSAKYSAMTISLTFLLFFLVEILNKKKTHPFQYALVGLALCLFYVLLISISEHSNFNLAYGIATMAITTMITLYAASFFKARKIVILLALILLGVYGFVFVTLQMTEFALLLGSIGLTVILGATMYFTRNINWYNTQETQIETT